MTLFHESEGLWNRKKNHHPRVQFFLDGSTMQNDKLSTQKNIKNTWVAYNHEKEMVASKTQNASVSLKNSGGFVYQAISFGRAQNPPKKYWTLRSILQCIQI